MFTRRVALLLCLAVPATALADPPQSPPPPASPGAVGPQIAKGGHRACRQSSPAATRLSNGATVLQFTIAADGAVQDVVVKQSSGSEALDKVAADCVATWHYVPASNNGEPQSVPWTATIDWHVH